MKKNKKIVVITGASSGIGEAAAFRFLEKNTSVYNLDIKKNPRHPAEIQFLSCDISNLSEVESAVNQIFKQKKRIDILLANAGCYTFGNLEETSVENIHKLIDVNIKGSVFTLKAVLPIMKKQKSGIILLTGSDQTLAPKPDTAVYAVTKAAIGQLVKSTTMDYAKYGIRVNCICPGTVDTPIYEQFLNQREKKTGLSQAQIKKEVVNSIPLKRIASTDEIAELMFFLCSEKCAFMTGSFISADGGAAL